MGVIYISIQYFFHLFQKQGWFGLSWWGGVVLLPKIWNSLVTLLNAFLWVLCFQDIAHRNICNVKRMWTTSSVYVLASWTDGLWNWLQSVLLKQDKYLWTIQNPLFWNVKCGPSGIESSRCFLSAFGMVRCCSAFLAFHKKLRITQLPC